jgi:hypothetical protein
MYVPVCDHKLIDFTTYPQRTCSHPLCCNVAPRSLPRAMSSPLRASALSPERSGYAIGPSCLALVGGHSPGLRTCGEGGTTASGASHRSQGGGRRRRHAPSQLKKIPALWMWRSQPPPPRPPPLPPPPPPPPRRGHPNVIHRSAPDPG